MRPAGLQDWARKLGGEVSGGQILCPGPGHSKNDRSLCVRLSPTSPDGFVVYSFCGDDPLLCRDYVRAKIGLPKFRPAGGHHGPAGGALKEAVSALHNDETKRKRAIAIWDQAVDPRGTLVEIYLRSRRLKLPVEAANEAIRFHPDCQFGERRFPAMICLVRGIVTNEAQAVHRTALATDGTAVKRDGKTLRMSLGPIVGGAIKIDRDEDVTYGLVVGEGVETALAGRQLGLQPVWSVINVGGIASFQVLPGIDCIQILRENDEASAKAVESCARRWFEAGREAIVVSPRFGSDVNDATREVAQ